MPAARWALCGAVAALLAPAAGASPPGQCTSGSPSCLDESVGFVQHNVRAHTEGGAGAPAAPAAGEAPALKGQPQDAFCDLYPESCRPPAKFDCGSTSEDSLGKLKADSHNWRWCWTDPAYLNYTKMCQSGHLKGASEFLIASLRANEGELLPYEAQYCFAAGHCGNGAITESSTFEDGEAQCDLMYNRSAWKAVHPAAMGMRPHHKGPASQWGLVACSMGLFHCDVVYCQENYCKDEAFLAEFGHLATPRGEVALVARDTYEAEMEARVVRIMG